MPNHYSDIGFIVNEIQDISRILDELPPPSCRIDTQDGYYEYRLIDQGIEFWAYHDVDGEMTSLDFHYNNNHAVPVKMVRWITDDKNEANTIKVSYPRENTIFPIIADVTNSALHRELSNGDEFMLQVSCFAESMDLFYPSDAGYSKEDCFIPTSSFEKNGEANLGSMPSNAMISGIIIDHKKCQNSIDGGVYYVITIRCHDALLDVISDAAFVDKEPQKGAVIKGTFWLSAKIIR